MKPRKRTLRVARRKKQLDLRNDKKWTPAHEEQRRQEMREFYEIDVLNF